MTPHPPPRKTFRTESFIFEGDEQDDKSLMFRRPLNARPSQPTAFTGTGVDSQIGAMSEKADTEHRGRVVNGREYLGRGGWRRVDEKEKQLRDEKQ